MGYVRVDRTTCFAQIGSDGRFEVKDVPVGHSYFILIRATLPNYTTGKPRSRMGSGAQAQTVVMLSDDSARDLGDMAIHPPQIDANYASPAWAGDDILLCQHSGWSRYFRIGVAKRTWGEANLAGKEPASGGAFSLSPDAKMLSFASGASMWILDASDHGEVMSAKLVEGLSIENNAGRIWTKDSESWLCAGVFNAFLGDERHGVPALLLAKPGEKQVYILKRWPQATGGRILGIALDAGENVAYLAMVVSDSKRSLGELWAWDSRTDVTTRLTSLGDVVGVSGR
jgi:hypothetical protein